MTRGDSRHELIEAETQRLLRLGRPAINSLDIPEEEARRNIHDFLERLPQFDEPSTDPRNSENDPS